MDSIRKSALLIPAFWLLTCTTLASAAKLNITAIGTADGKSTLECWQLDAPFVADNTPGIKGSVTAPLMGGARIHFFVIPANLDGGLHNAPANQ